MDPFEEFGGKAEAATDDPFAEFGGAAVPDEVINEQHPGISFGERLRQGNLGPNAASQRKDLLSQGFEVGGEGDDIQVRKPGERPWRRVDPEGFDWMDILDLGNEATSAVTTTAGTVYGGPGGAALAAGGTEAARLGLANASGFDVGLEDVVTGVGSEAILGGVSEVGARAIGKVGKWGLNKLRGPAVEAAETAPRGLLKPIAAEAAEAPVETAVKPEVAQFKAALSPGAAPQEAAEGLLKSPEELDALLKPEAQAGVRMQPGAAETPPGLQPGWTAGHKAGGETARGIQEVGRHTPSRVFEGNYGPVTLVQGSRDQAKRLLDEAGDEGASILYVKNPPKGDLAGQSELRYFHNARPIARGPEAFPGEGATSFAENLKGWSDEDVLKLLHQRKAKIKGKMQPDFYGTTDINRLSREQMEDLLFRSQPNVVQGPRALKRDKKTGEVHYGAKKAKSGEDFDYQGNRTGHGLEGIWEKTGDDLDVGHYRDIHFDKILEMRIGKKVYRFSEEGKPVLAGTTDEIPLPTEAMIAPTAGAAPQLLKMAPKQAEKVAKLTAPAAATPQALAARGIMPPGAIGKLADLGDKAMALPQKAAAWIGEKAGLEKDAMGLLKGVSGLAGAVPKAAGKLATGGLRKIDQLLQPGGVARALASAPPSVRPALEGIQHALETRGEQAARGMLYVVVRSTAGSDLREWLENEETPPGGGASPSF